ncbi:putative regulator of cell autolysis [Lachnospiraceae bacterium JC7]|nr:putative regulator of cell autolysis [Lachnospiraceae bacterium JC7]
MKSLQREIKENHIIFCVSLVLIICINLFLSMQFMRRYSDYMSNYRKINKVEIAFNDSRKFFHLYNKEREDSAYELYDNSLSRISELLESIGRDVSGDRQSRMMLRIVSQMMDHRTEVIEGYVSPGSLEKEHGIDYIEELDLLIESNLNLLTTSYLDYVTASYEETVKTQGFSLILINLLLALGDISILFLNRYLFDKIFESVKKLRDAASEIGKRNFEGEDVPDDKYEEIHVVVNAFNGMKHTIRDMIEEINRNFEMKDKLSAQMLENEKQKRRLAESKMKELQLQINPHFLFNTLSLVIRSIQLEENKTAVMLIKAISKILRSSIETHALAIPLDEEIELLESYLYIQRVHCKDRIALVLDVRKSYMEEDVLVPPLIIQPLVENSISHGLMNVTENGKVSIAITEKPDFIEVKVSDNGCGLSQETLDDLKAHRTGKRIGLLNVLERLQLLYHREDVMNITTGDTGTEIAIYFFKNNDGSAEISKS